MHNYVATDDLLYRERKTRLNERDDERLLAAATRLGIKPAVLIRIATLRAVERIEREGYIQIDMA